MATSPFAQPLGVPIFRWFDANGNPAAAYQVATYVAGTNTPLASYPTYVDALAGANPNANPVVLDPNGAAQIWVQALAYKIVILLPVALGSGVVYTQDNVSYAIGYPGAFLSQWVPETNPVVYLAVNQFRVDGVDATAVYTTGQRVKVQVTAGLRYATVRSSAFAVNTTVTVDIDSGLALDAGLSAVWYGLNSYTNPSYLSPRTALSVVKNGNMTGFAAATKIINWTVENDPNGEWDAANNRWVPRYPGRYLCMLSLEYADTGTNVDGTIEIRRNAGGFAQGRVRSSPTASQIWSNGAHGITNVTTPGAAAAIEAYLTMSVNATVQGTVGSRLTVVSIP